MELQIFFDRDIIGKIKAWRQGIVEIEYFTLASCFGSWYSIGEYFRTTSKLEMRQDT